ncbi:MAG: M15 family metallopeptidase [Chlorobiaceae bacterium]
MIRLFVVFFILVIALPVNAAENKDFVDIAELDSSILLDIRYATACNFTGKAMYPVARCLLRRDAALRLLRVEQKLRKQGCRLIIFDGYRPLSVQKKFWNILPDERYVADPAKGSRHNRGAAVDVSMADLAGHPLPMPSEYDDFSLKAHRGYTGASLEAQKNCALLEAAMKEEGFDPFPTEWWHFDAPGWERYPVSDFSLEEFRGNETYEKK